MASPAARAGRFGQPRGRAGRSTGPDVDDYRYLYEIRPRTIPSPGRHDRHVRVLNETPPAQLEQALAPLLDIDEVLRFLAVEVTLVNSDGYWTRASDYNIYMDPKGKFHVIPHDVNETMSGDSGFGFRFGGGGGPRLSPLVAIDDPIKPLRSRLLRVPALRERYLGYVRDIATNWLDWTKLEPLVDQYRALIAEEIKADAHGLYGFQGFESGPVSIKRFADERRAFLLQCSLIGSGSPESTRSSRPSSSNIAVS